MAKRTFMEILTEIGSVTNEYSAIIIRAHESGVPLYEDKDAYDELLQLKRRLDVLLQPILSISEYKDRTYANERMTAMQNAIGSSIYAIESHNRKKNKPD